MPLTANKSVLRNATKADVSASPFPHIVLKDVLDDSTCLQLITDFPSLEVVTKGKSYSSNERFSYPAVDVLNDPAVSLLWRELIKEHVSQNFLFEMLNLFEDHIRAAYPTIEDSYGPLTAWRAGIRSKNNFDEADALLDAQICVNTPVIDIPSSVRRGHLDMPDKLLAGLFYLRHPDDDSTGGELELFTYKNGRTGRFKQLFIEDKYIKRVQTVKYERNVLVLFLNSRFALHGVSFRSVTNVTRLFMNIVCNVRRPLFEIEPLQKKWWQL